MGLSVWVFFIFNSGLSKARQQQAQTNTSDCSSLRLIAAIRREHALHPTIPPLNQQVKNDVNAVKDLPRDHYFWNCRRISTQDATASSLWVWSVPVPLAKARFRSPATRSLRRRRLRFHAKHGCDRLRNTEEVFIFCAQWPFGKRCLNKFFSFYFLFICFHCKQSLKCSGVPRRPTKANQCGHSIITTLSIYYYARRLKTDFIQMLRSYEFYWECPKEVERPTQRTEKTAPWQRLLQRKSSPHHKLLLISRGVFSTVPFLCFNHHKLLFYFSELSLLFYNLSYLEEIHLLWIFYLAFSNKFNKFRKKSRRKLKKK